MKQLHHDEAAVFRVDGDGAIPGIVVDAGVFLQRKRWLGFRSPGAFCFFHAEFVVFGVVTEYCVGFAVKGLIERGRRVAVVQDAIETLNKEEGEKAIAEFQRMGARMITTDQALAALAG